MSVLFADLVGFTPFAEERDSEDVREILSRYFDLASEIVGRYGGTVEKFIGDAVMAVWGTPVAHEDDAERAVRSALELVASVQVLGAGIQARAGVLTGETAVTLGAKNQGMVAGDIVNTAARLQAAASPGTVLVGEATQRAASGAIAFEPAGEQVLKGKTTPVPAWRALRVVAERGGRGRADALEAPFVGRDDELQLVKDLYHATAREGRTRLVSITGVGGIGKSRLAWELEKYLDGIVGTIWWHHGRSPAYGAGISFWALSEMIRGRARLAETDDERTTRVAIERLVVEHDVPEADRRWIESALLALVGVDTGIGSEQLFGGWRAFFERLAASGPVVMVFEDLHWADTGTIDFIDHVLEWSRSIPLYIVTLARPELEERRPDWGAGRRNFTSLYLEPLPDPAMRELLGGLVPGLPENAVRAIVARAEGIPLYAVETVRMLVADGRLELRDGVYVPTGDLTELAIPETLSALIAARLDGLDPSDRALVLDAAVLGQSFTPAGLAAVSGLDEAALTARLRDLVRRELFAHETDPRSAERGQYAFVQALIREVAYNTLARADRKARHIAAARFFESLPTEELASALAGHYLAARENATEGPEADAIAAQARVALRGAAERAASLGGHDQALGFYEQAMAVTTGAAERAALLELAGDSASAAGRHQAAERHLRAALAAYREVGDRLGVARATTRLGAAMNQAYRVAEAVALLEPALGELEDLSGAPEVVGLTSQLARAHFLAQDDRKAIAVADAALERAERAELRAIVADTLITKGTALTNIGRAIEGLSVLRAGEAVAEAEGLTRTVIRAAINRGLAEVVSDPRAAFETARAGLARARQFGLRTSAQRLLGNAVDFGFPVGEWAWARGEVDAALTEELEAPDRLALLTGSVGLSAMMGERRMEERSELDSLAAVTSSRDLQSGIEGAAAWEAVTDGRLQDARAAFLRMGTDSNANLTTALAFAAMVALWLRDRSGATQDLAMLDDSGVHGAAVEADRTSIRAGIAALDGEANAALLLYREALRAWRDLRVPFKEALTVIDMATLLGPSDPDVRAAAESAREILVGLGAKPFVERLDAAMEEAATSRAPDRSIRGDRAAV